jgi:uncharacterized protein (DUF433 family)
MEAERVYKDLLWQDSDRVSGAVCFYGTRLPVQHMFDYLEGGQNLEEFCADYAVPLEMAKAVLELASRGISKLLEAA